MDTAEQVTTPAPTTKRGRKPKLKLVRPEKAPREPKVKRGADEATVRLANVCRLLVALQGDQAMRYLEQLQAEAREALALL